MQSDDKKQTVRTLMVWLALAVLTGVTVAAGRIELGTGNVVAALLIACVKASLVALLFMHLFRSAGVNRLVFAISLVFVVLLGVGVVTDLGTRLPVSVAPGSLPARAGQ
jgi:cytochrome c oxidase subunit 4